jgi:hypothetical protein
LKKRGSYGAPKIKLSRLALHVGAYSPPKNATRGENKAALQPRCTFTGKCNALSGSCVNRLSSRVSILSPLQREVQRTLSRVAYPQKKSYATQNATRLSVTIEPIGKREDRKWVKHRSTHRRSTSAKSIVSPRRLWRATAPIAAPRPPESAKPRKRRSERNPANERRGNPPLGKANLFARLRDATHYAAAAFAAACQPKMPVIEGIELRSAALSLAIRSK